jgi:hypothetical protein
MKNILMHIFNKSKQYTNRMFYACMNNRLVLHYYMLFSAVSMLDKFISQKVKHTTPYIVLISNNILFKIIVFTYCFLTNSKLLLISPKFSLSEIINAMLSKRNTNILFIDQDILSSIQLQEREEGLHILSFFKYVETTLRMLELLTQIDNEYKEGSLSSIVKKGRIEALFDDEPCVEILSPGTTSESCITKVPYKLLGQSMLDLSFFMGLKPTDKVSVIADFEFFPGIYTILGLLNGIEFVLPETDNYINGEDITHHFQLTEHKPNVLLITSNKFKLLWDKLLLDVYSSKFMFTFSKYIITRWITDKVVLCKLRKVLGKQITKVHILNEELGFEVLDILKKSKIMFTSSYGFLEQGNFLAFKDPELFKHKDFIHKPGGTLLKHNHVVIDKGIGQIELNIEEGETWRKVIMPKDIGMIIKNISNQGDREYLYVYAKAYKFDCYDELRTLPSLDLIEKSIKDTWLIRDCSVQRYITSDGQIYHNLLIEVREDLLDYKQIPWHKVNSMIKLLASELDKKSSIKVNNYAIISFNAMRNVAGKLQHYLI